MQKEITLYKRFHLLVGITALHALRFLYVPYSSVFQINIFLINV